MKEIHGTEFGNMSFFSDYDSSMNTPILVQKLGDNTSTIYSHVTSTRHVHPRKF